MIIYTISEDQSDLEGILKLQQENLPKHLDQVIIQREGFVTVEHNLELLSQMNTPHPHIIAKHGSDVVGYTLVMLKEMAASIPVLVSLFQQIDQLQYKGQRLSESSYFVMGQVCIAKSHRGNGLFKGMYDLMREKMQGHFDYLVTTISKSNPRSLRAHAKVGFQTIQTYQDEKGGDWVMVLLELNEK